MKNAIILSGHYRSFNSVKENLKKFIEANDLDVYFHLWSTDENEINDIVNTLSPIRYIAEDNLKISHMFVNDEIEILNRRNLLTPDKLADQASMYYSRTSAYKLIEKKYDHIVFARFDLQIIDPFIIEKTDAVITPIEGSWSSLSDIFAIIPEKYAKSYFLYDNFVNLHSMEFSEEFISYFISKLSFSIDEFFIPNQANRRYDPHTLLLKSFFMDDVPFEKISIPVQLQR